MILNLVKNVAKTLMYLNLVVLFGFTLKACGPHIPTTSLNIQGEINDSSASAFISNLRLVTKVNKVLGRSSIKININSFGGSVISGHDMIVAMEEARNKGNLIYCFVDKAGSMAFTILQYCDARIATPNAILMQHRIHKGDGRENLVFESKEEMVTMEFLDRLHGIDEANRMNMPFEEYEQKYEFSKWYKGYEACLDNVIDVVDAGPQGYIPCFDVTAARDQLKRELDEKASNAKIGR